MQDSLRERVARAISGTDDPRYVWADEDAKNYWLQRADAAIQLVDEEWHKGERNGQEV